MGDDIIIYLWNPGGERWQRAMEYKTNPQNLVLFFILVVHIVKEIPFYKNNKKNSWVMTQLGVKKKLSFWKKCKTP